MMSSPDNTNNSNGTEPGQQDQQPKPLSHRDAEAASPEDYSVCGEEDPGSALESMVDDHKK
ncbi:hypothetical protein [Arsukibacterium sp.]|uniref:hypothetical protein n=1 Tax=Arsukibacterium sp. TaxID=1977258 RepID=UPI001BD22E27|nr:hypothetical protein [Arsukibacterium sp.]